MKKKVLILLIFIFILWTILVMSGCLKDFDYAIYNSIISNRSSGLDIFFKNITKFGNTKGVLFIVFLVIVLMRNKFSLYLSMIAVINSVVMTIVKNIVRRDRPNILRLIKQGGFSFPSGHSMISVSIYGFLIYYVITNVKNKYLRYLFCIVLFTLIILVGLSRIYVGVHYPSDVIGGYLLSSIILIIVIDQYNSRGSDKNGKNGCI